MVKYKILGIIFILLTLSSCTIPTSAYQLPPPSWYEAQNYGSLTYWIAHWERVLQEENRKCYHNYPHDHRYHRYVIKHLDLLYRYRGHMELRYRTCNYY